MPDGNSALARRVDAPVERSGGGGPAAEAGPDHAAGPVGAAVGYGPKTLERVLRFRRFLDLAAREPAAGLAGLAAAAGYADQAHLTRECGRLAGAPPGRLVGRLAPAA